MGSGQYCSWVEWAEAREEVSILHCPGKLHNEADMAPDVNGDEGEKE